MTCREAGVGVYLPLETQDGADIALLLAALADASLLTIVLIAALGACKCGWKSRTPGEIAG